MYASVLQKMKMMKAMLNGGTVKIIIFVASIIFSLGGLYATVSNVRSRMDNTEKIVGEHERKIVAIDTKIDYIIKTVDEIKQDVKMLKNGKK